MTRNQRKIRDRLERVQRELPYCELRILQRGVPHLVVHWEPFKLSVCYFGRRHIFKVFWPYPSGYGRQRYEKFRTVAEVVNYIKGSNAL